MQRREIGIPITLVLNCEDIIDLKLQIIYRFSDDTSVYICNTVKYFLSRPQDNRVYSVHMLLQGVLYSSYNPLYLGI